MIVYFFRWRLHSGAEERFRQGWSEMTRGLLEQGSQGSALFRAHDGSWCGIARWPDKAVRDAAQSGPELASARALMADAIEEVVEVLELSEDLNLWAPYP